MKPILELNFGDVMPDTPTGVCCFGCCSVINFILLVLFFPCTVTQIGQFKYGLAKNKITGTVDLEKSFAPGRYWIGFWKQFIEFPSTLNTIEFSDDKPEKGVQHLSKLVSRDNEGKQIFLDVSIQYRLQKPELGRIYKEMTVLYEDIYISDLRDQLSKAANQFSIAQAWTEYPFVVNTMFTKCKEILAKKGAECWGLQLWGVSVSSQYENQLIKTQVQKQKKETSQAQMLQAQVRAETGFQLAAFTRDIQIVNAQATANQINIEREAKATAESNLVQAQAKVLQIIKTNVNLILASNNSYTGNVSAAYLTDEQLVTYQKYVMLQEQEQSHIIVDLADGVGSLNAASARKLLGTGRANEL